jgi:hypothetical protein
MIFVGSCFEERGIGTNVAVVLVLAMGEGLAPDERLLDGTGGAGMELKGDESKVATRGSCDLSEPLRGRGIEGLLDGESAGLERGDDMFHTGREPRGEGRGGGEREREREEKGRGKREQ